MVNEKLYKELEMIPLRETSRRTGFSYDALRKMCLRGEIAHVRCGNKFLINYGALCEYLAKAGIREDAQ